MRMRQMFLISMAFVLFFPLQIQAEAIKVKIERPGQPTETVVIVQVKDEAALQEVKQQFPQLAIRHEFQTLFHGFSAAVDEPTLQKLKRHVDVVQVEKPATYHVALDDSVPFIGGDVIRQSIGNKYGALTGKGIKVGVIDTGVDYTHPDLVRSYKGGYDLVDDDDDPMETLEHNEYPATLHGTHVAGIIAANGKIKGVAPEAEIYAYRALGPGGYGTSEQVIQAIERAVADGMDVINLSLGNSVNGPDWITSIALNKAVEHGVVAVTSNGNSGPQPWTVGSPGTAEKAISVAASSPPLQIPYLEANITPEMIAIEPLRGTKKWEDVLPLHQYELIDGQKGYPDQIQGARGKIVLLERGELEFDEKVRNAQTAGAAAVLIYNNEDGPFQGALQEQFPIPVYSLTKKDGEALKRGIKDKNVWIKTKLKEITDDIASFSSRGPVTHTWSVKPDISAPGVEIDSTVPDGYLPLQGTSMAAPHIAGAAALLLEAHPDWSPEQVKAAIMNTAKLLEKNGKPLKPTVQGAGRIQLKEAIEANTLLYPSSLSFGMLEQKAKRTVKTKEIIVENTSNEPIQYFFQMPEAIEGIQWKLPQTFSLLPGEKRNVKLSIDVQPKMVKGGIYEHFVTVVANGRKIHLPYIFVIDTPNFPRVMGFDFQYNEEKSIYEYSFYLPEQAEEVTITLFEAQSLYFAKTLYRQRNVQRGANEHVVHENELGLPDGIYVVAVTATHAGKEDSLMGYITIGTPPETVLKEDSNRKNTYFVK